MHASVFRLEWMLQRGTPPPCGCFRSEDLAVYCQLPRVGRCGFDLVDGEALDGLRRSRVAERLVDEQRRDTVQRLVLSKQHLVCEYPHVRRASLLRLIGAGVVVRARHDLACGIRPPAARCLDHRAHVLRDLHRGEIVAHGGTILAGHVRLPSAPHVGGDALPAELLGDVLAQAVRRDGVPDRTGESAALDPAGDHARGDPRLADAGRGPHRVDASRDPNILFPAVRLRVEECLDLLLKLGARARRARRRALGICRLGLGSLLVGVSPAEPPGVVEDRAERDLPLGGAVARPAERRPVCAQPLLVELVGTAAAPVAPYRIAALVPAEPLEPAADVEEHVVAAAQFPRQDVFVDRDGVERRAQPRFLGRGPRYRAGLWLCGVGLVFVLSLVFALAIRLGRTFAFGRTVISFG